MILSPSDSITPAPIKTPSSAESCLSTCRSLVESCLSEFATALLILPYRTSPGTSFECFAEPNSAEQCYAFRLMLEPAASSSNINLRLCVEDRPSPKIDPFCDFATFSDSFRPLIAEFFARDLGDTHSFFLMVFLRDIMSE